jgi:hypothetical protein
MEKNVYRDGEQPPALPFAAESAIERQIVADPAWERGAWWGEPRPGHPEGAVAYHIADVLANVDRLFPNSPDRMRLRLIALVHDSFKYLVDPSRPKIGDNQHGTIAARFLERFTDDAGILLVTRTHDDAFSAWRLGARRGDWQQAEDRGRQLIQTLGPHLDLYLAFFACDNRVEGKAPDSYDWFVALAAPQDAGAPRQGIPEDPVRQHLGS